MFSGVMKAGCLNRCYLKQVSCETGRPIGSGSYKGAATGVKPGGGVLSTSTAGSQGPRPRPQGSRPRPQGSRARRSSGANGGGKPVVKPITRR
jgi:hypothetical protein